MDPRSLPDLDAGYRQIREECGLLESEVFVVSLSGPDAAEFLQGQVTNDVEAIEPGEGLYALLLDRKGHIQAEMEVLRTAPESFLLLTAPGTGPDLEGHLRTYSIGHDVEVSSRIEAAIALLGPACHEITGTAPLGEHHSRTISIAGRRMLAVDSDLGLMLLSDGSGDSTATSDSGTGPLVEELLSAGAEKVGPEAVEIIRVERGVPLFGREMDAENMPAEAGIVERAVSFEKGCYIGQEPVARLHYKGRPNRHLRGLKLERAVEPGSPIRTEEREVGRIGSVVVSPALGPIALAILRREASPGDEVLVGEGESATSARVVELPFPEGFGGNEL